MKNGTIIGIVCMILAVAMTFAIAPVVNRLTSDTTTVVRLKQEVGRGTKITEDQVETVKVKTDNRRCCLSKQRICLCRYSLLGSAALKPRKKRWLLCEKTIN